MSASIVTFMALVLLDRLVAGLTGEGLPGLWIVATALAAGIDASYASLLLVALAAAEMMTFIRRM